MERNLTSCLYNMDWYFHHCRMQCVNFLVERTIPQAMCTMRVRILDDGIFKEGEITYIVIMLLYWYNLPGFLLTLPPPNSVWGFQFWGILPVWMYLVECFTFLLQKGMTVECSTVFYHSCCWRRVLYLLALVNGYGKGATLKNSLVLRVPSQSLSKCMRPKSENPV